ncbi:MAG: hypothetical protein ACTHNS_02105 [Marmoricola sp.]
MTTTEYLRAFARFWWLIALSAVLGTMACVVAQAVSPLPYESTSNVRVVGAPTAQTGSAEATATTVLAKQRMATYAEVARGPKLPSALREHFGLSMTDSQFQEELTATVPTDTTILQLTVADPDPARAQQLANESANEMVKIVDQIERVKSPAPTLLKARVLSEADGPRRVESSAAWRNPALSGATGLLVGLALAVALTRAAPRARDEYALSQLAGAPVLGGVARPPGRARAGRSRGAAAYAASVSALRTSVFFLRKDEDVCLRLVLTSTVPEAVLARVWRDLAAALAEAGARVLLVDADLHGGSGSGTPTEGGLSGYLSDETAGPLPAHRGPTAGLDLVPAGPALEGATEAVHSPRVSRLLDQASKAYDFVLIQAPPMSVGEDASALAARCDGAVLAVSSRTRPTEVRGAVERLRRVSAQIQGLVRVS